MMALIVKFHFLLLFLQICSFQQVLSLSPPPQDPEWPGWWCGGSYFGEQGVKCAKLLNPSYTATQAEAGDVCAAQKREGDLFTPHPLLIRSKEDEDLAISSIMWGAYLWEGGNIGVLVAQSSYRDSKLPPWTPPAAFGATLQNSSSNETQTSLSVKSLDLAPITATNSSRNIPGNVPGNIPECGELRIEVAYHGSNGQPSGYGFNPSTVSWVPRLCSQRSRVVCQTRKLTVTGVLNTINRQKKELEALATKVEDGRRELATLGESHCGVEPKSRVECGWGGIKAWQCLQRGCCFDSSVVGVKWCFKKVRDNSKFV